MSLCLCALAYVGGVNHFYDGKQGLARTVEVELSFPPPPFCPRPLQTSSTSLSSPRASHTRSGEREGLLWREGRGGSGKGSVAAGRSPPWPEGSGHPTPPHHPHPTPPHPAHPVRRDTADSLREFFYHVSMNRAQGAINMVLEAYHWIQSHHPYWWGVPLGGSFRLPSAAHPLPAAHALSAAHTCFRTNLAAALVHRPASWSRLLSRCRCCCRRSRDRRGGRDHIWLFTHDEGTCWAPAAIKNSIILGHWG